MKHGLHFLLWTAVFVAPVPTAADDGGDNPYAYILDRHGIPPTLAGVTKFLESLDPRDEERKRHSTLAAKLVTQLGDDDFQKREIAYRTLLAMVIVPEAELQQAAKSDDPEVAWRAKSILLQTRKETGGHGDTLSAVTEAVCGIICYKKIKGAAPVLLKSVARFDDRSTVKAVTDALAVTAQPQDANLLREALAAENADIRIAAARALAAALGRQARNDLAALLEDDDQRVQLVAARALASHGDRASLPVLVRLLESPEMDVRLGGIRTLRALSGKRFDYLAYEDAEKRKPAIEKWARWVQGEGKTAALALPLDEVKVEIGRTLITDYGSGKVIEVDHNGKQVWQLNVKSPWGCQGLPNGNRLISSYTGKFVAEYEQDGNEVWKVERLPGNAMGLHRLDNGNTLVACSTSNHVVEYRRDGSIAWDVAIAGRPVDVERLENGRTLVALEANDQGRKVVEVDRKGKIVWQIADVNRPLSVQRLENGNTLVAMAQSNRVVEYDRTGKVVWEHKTSTKATYARRASNGDTVVACHRFVQCLDKSGRIRWEVKGLKYCYGMDHY